MNSPLNIEVVVRGEIKDGYRLKVSCLDLGMYLDGFRATRSAKSRSGWWIQPPSFKAGIKWITVPEFDKSADFWKSIEQSCIEAAENGSVTSDDASFIPTDDEMTDEAISKGLDEALEQMKLTDEVESIKPAPRRYHE